MKQRLLRTGMGCYGCFGAMMLLNCALLPFGRKFYGVSLPLEMVGAALMAGLVVLLQKTRGSEGRLLGGLLPAFLIVFPILSVGIGYLMEYVPSGDNFMLYNGSLMLARDGNFAANPDFGLYLARFSNQWGFLLMLTAYRRALMFLGIASPFLPLVVLQAGLHTLGYGLFLGTLRRREGERTALLFLLGLMLTPMTWLAPGSLYTDTFSLPFVLLTLRGVWRTLDAHRGGRNPLPAAAMTGLWACIGGQIKMTVAIVLIAGILRWMLTLPLRRGLGCAALSAGVLLLGTAGVRMAVLGPVVDPAVYRQENTPLVHWFLMSIPSADNPYGGYNSEDYAVTWGMMDEGAGHDEVMASIYSRMKDKIYTLRYPDRLLMAMLRKNSAIGSDGTFGMTELLDDRPVRPNLLSGIVLEGGKGYPAYLSLMTGAWLGILAVGVLRTWDWIARRETGRAEVPIALFGILLFLMNWEARSRVLYSFYPVFLCLSCMGGGGFLHKGENAALTGQTTGCGETFPARSD